jgi:hypothetical protein
MFSLKSMTKLEDLTVPPLDVYAVDTRRVKKKTESES